MTVNALLGLTGMCYRKFCIRKCLALIFRTFGSGMWMIGNIREHVLQILAVYGHG